MNEQTPLKRHVVRTEETDAETFVWGSIRWLDNAALTGNEVLTFGVVEILPGQANPEHHHPNCDEVLYVVQGAIDHSLGDEIHHLAAGDIIHIPAGVKHRAWNRGEVTCRVCVAYNTGRRETVGKF